MTKHNEVNGQHMMHHDLMPCCLWMHAQADCSDPACKRIADEVFWQGPKPRCMSLWTAAASSLLQISHSMNELKEVFMLKL